MFLRGKLPLVGRMKLFSKGLPLVWETASALGTYNAGTPISRSFAVNQPATYSVVAGTLPTGLTLSQAGALTGTLENVGGTSTFTVRATAMGRYLDREFSLGVVAATITWVSPDSALNPIERGSVISVPLSATSSLGRSVTYAVTSGSLPAGVTIAGDTISGTINGSAGSYSFTITASDGVAFESRTFSLFVRTPLAKASASNFNALIYNGSAVSNLQDIQTIQNGFRIVLVNSFYNLAADSETSSFRLNFSEDVTLKHIMVDGSSGGPALMVVEYFAGQWFRAATYNTTTSVWTINSAGSVSADWRVRMENAGRAGIGTITITV